MQLGEVIGKRVRHVSWLSPQQWFIPYFQDAKGSFYGLNNDGWAVNYDDDNEGWEEWKGPAKKKMIWQWAYRAFSSKERYTLSLLMESEEEARRTFKSCVYYKIPGTGIEVVE